MSQIFEEILFRPTPIDDLALGRRRVPKSDDLQRRFQA